MEITKDQAVILAQEYVKKAITDKLKSCKPVDRLPEGSTYLPDSWKDTDYWLIPLPALHRNLQTGGDTTFITVCKNTGKVSTITVHVE